MLKYGQDYMRQSQDLYEQTYQQRLHKSLAKKTASLGYKLVLETLSENRARRPSPVIESRYTANNPTAVGSWPAMPTRCPR